MATANGSPCQIVIFNGPPGCGKDYAAAHLVNGFSATHQELKERVVEIVCTIYGLTRAQWDAMYTREQKEWPQQALEGRSPRQALIHTAEEVIKPAYGKGFFGKATARLLAPGLNAVSDGGFIEEVEAFAKLHGASNLLVMRVHRPGCSWRDDSRGYLDSKALDQLRVRHVDLDNPGTPRFFVDIEDCLHEVAFLGYQPPMASMSEPA